ncbi:MAG: hypothetical protein CMJ18_03570 [Phycisphaeraceae bacterium]|nr:hypothetical protein [Phycisphaeraceae bacterium]
MLAAAAAPAALSADTVVFVSHYLERGTMRTEPRPEQIVDVVRMAAAPGEYEPATVSIRASKPLEGVRLEIAGALKGEEGQSIPADALTVRLVDPLQAWTKQKDLEQLLIRSDGVDIPADTTRRFWITAKVPADAAPGTYRTTLVVGRPSGKLGPDLMRLQTIRKLTLELEVLPIALATAAETGMAFFMYNNTAYYAKGPGGAEALITEDYQTRVFEDMREHGMTTATVYLYPDVDGKPALDQRRENHLSMTATMRMLDQTRLVAPGLPVIWLGAGAYGPEHWTAVSRARQEHGWPELIYYAVDEPEEEDRNVRVRAFMRRFNKYRANHRDFGLRVTTALGSSRGIQTVGHFYDLWIACMGQRIGESGVISDAKMHDKELWTYDCMAAPVNAEMDRYYFGLWAWVSGVRGCSHWAYYDAGPQLSYVHAGPDGPVPTVGWEAVREGIDDYRYLFTLRRWQQKAAEAGRADLVEAAEQVFARARSMVTMDSYGRCFLSVRGVEGEAGPATAYHRPRPEPQLQIEAWDELRQSVVERIQEIAEAG